MATRADYPADWRDIAAALKAHADNRCEACGVEHGPVPHILTVHHLDRDKLNPPAMPATFPHDNLIALCQRCHLRAEHWALAGEYLTRAECLERLEAIATELGRQRELELEA
jgi:hypothetical protein